MKRLNDRAYLASTLQPSPERLEREPKLIPFSREYDDRIARAMLATVALLGFVALLAIGLVIK